MKDLIYFDFNATTPICKTVADCMHAAVLNLWSNPSSNYNIGMQAKEAIETARIQVANLIDAKSNEIIFTSCGTESNNLVFNSILPTTDEVIDNNVKDVTIPHVIISCIEHDSVLLPARYLAKTNKIRLTEVPIEPLSGKVNLKELKKSLCPETKLVSVMIANNETGIIQPIKQIAKILKNYSEEIHSTSKILFHSDSAQAIGKIQVSVEELEVDYLTLVGHKFHGPRIGALYVRNHLNTNAAPLKPLFYGGSQEKGFRPGTENTPMIVGLGKACELVTINLLEYQSHMRSMRTLLERELFEQFTGIPNVNVKILSWFSNNRTNFDSTTTSSNNFGINSITEFDDLTHRLPSTCSVSFIVHNRPHITGKSILSKCQLVCASVGAACHQYSRDDDLYSGSSILIQSGRTRDEARGAIRLSIGRETTADEVRRGVADIKNAIEQLIQGEQVVNAFVNGDARRKMEVKQ